MFQQAELSRNDYQSVTIAPKLALYFPSMCSSVTGHTTLPRTESHIAVPSSPAADVRLRYASTTLCHTMSIWVSLEQNYSMCHPFEILVMPRDSRTTVVPCAPFPVSADDAQNVVRL